MLPWEQTAEQTIHWDFLFNPVPGSAAHTHNSHFLSSFLLLSYLPNLYK